MSGWREHIRKVTPYVPGEQPKQVGQGRMIKLNTNENPYPPAPEVAECLKGIDTEAFRLYPNTEAEPIVEALAERFALPRECFFIGVGSDDVLAMSFLTFFNGGQPVLFPDITYSFYDVWAEVFRIPYRRCPLDENFRIRKEDYLQPNGGIVLPNPNAPTGVEEKIETLEEIVSANRACVVIIDEAYVDFGAESILPLVEKYDNLMVVQTFSKSRAMAGVRIGFAIAGEKLIGYLKNVKFSFNSYTMNLPAIEMGTASVLDDAYFRETTAKIIRTREWTKKEFARLGFLFTDSKSNFLFATHPKVSAEELFVALKENNIYVRHWKKPRIENYLRITVGTQEEMGRLVSFIEQFLENY